MTAVLLGLTAGLLVVWTLDPWCRPPARRPGTDDATDAIRRPRPRQRSLTVEHTTLVGGGVAIAATTALTIASPPIGVIAALVGWILIRRTAVRRRVMLQQRREAAVPELIDTLVALVHAGLTPSLAWRELARCCPPDLRPPVDAVLVRIDNGATFADALGGFADDVGPTASVLVDTLVTAERYGLPLGPVLTRLSTEAAARRRRAVEARARQLPVRLSFPLVMCTLPSFVVLTVVPVLVTALSSLPRP